MHKHTHQNPNYVNLSNKYPCSIDSSHYRHFNHFHKHSKLTMKFENFVSYAMRLSHELHFNIINCTQNTEYCHFTIFAITLPMNTDYVSQSTIKLTLMKFFPKMYPTIWHNNETNLWMGCSCGRFNCSNSAEHPHCQNVYQLSASNDERFWLANDPND